MKAVITGDIIESTKMLAIAREDLIESINTLLNDLSKRYEMQSEIYRGDSFQCLIDKPQQVLRIALILKTHIRGAKAQNNSHKEKPSKSHINDARIAIGIGEVENPARSLGVTNGEAFLLSGHLIDKLKRTKQTFGISTADSFHSELETEAILMDNIISKATSFQCEVIKWKLLGYTEIEISNLLKIQQSAVNQRSNGVGWHAINAVVNRFEDIYNHG